MPNAKYYVFKKGKDRLILQSLGLVSKCSGIPYRTLIRKIKDKDVYYDPDGVFSIERMEFIQDGSKRNRNPNMN